MNGKLQLICRLRVRPIRILLRVSLRTRRILLLIGAVRICLGFTILGRCVVMRRRLLFLLCCMTLFVLVLKRLGCCCVRLILRLLLVFVLLRRFWLLSVLMSRRLNLSGLLLRVCVLTLVVRMILTWRLRGLISLLLRMLILLVVCFAWRCLRKVRRRRRNLLVRSVVCRFGLPVIRGLIVLKRWFRKIRNVSSVLRRLIRVVLMKRDLESLVSFVGWLRLVVPILLPIESD